MSRSTSDDCAANRAVAHRGQSGCIGVRNADRPIFRGSPWSTVARFKLPKLKVAGSRPVARFLLLGYIEALLHPGCPDRHLSAQIATD